MLSKIGSFLAGTNYIKIEPTLASELIAIIENQFNDGTPGFKNRGEKILNKLYKLTD